MERDLRIDLIRGYAMITICINHITWLLNKTYVTGFKIPSITHYGYSSAAEIFFFMSGCMVGLVYLNKDNSSQKLLNRAFHLFKTNIFLFISLVLVGLLLSSYTLSHITYLDYFYNNPTSSFINFIMLSYTPIFTDLLFIYTLLLLMSVPIAFVLEKSTKSFLVIIISIYIFSQFFPNFKLHNGAADSGLWSFNVLAYQFLFMIGILFGSKKLIYKLFNAIEKNTLTLCLPFSLFLFALVIKRYDILGFNDTWLIHKGNLGPLRIVHFFVVLSCLISGIHLLKKFKKSSTFLGIALIGRQSLSAFITSVLCAYVSLGFWLMSSQSPYLYLFLVLTSLTVMLIFSGIIDYKKKYNLSWFGFLPFKKKKSMICKLDQL
ncbi:OpgC domain-containing protein [Alteromonas stellipolaris]|uniref:OpgC domain-containing protein n=1 Tax=Alteromonas stellipolaris TaxID=233316 RepID=UPI00211858AD|nr:OpgC domain-containing protein [Alteromonas stellipolaris]MCQ8847210.1 OpgC domain-containing protein [Alteromonas stellipolaris]